VTRVIVRNSYIVFMILQPLYERQLITLATDISLMSCHWKLKIVSSSVERSELFTSMCFCQQEYTVNHKKGGSTFVIITLVNLDGFQ